MKIQNLSKHFIFEKYLQILVLFISGLLITGLFLPDLFLTFSPLFLSIYCVFKKESNFLNHKFFYFFLIFFSILVLSAILSDYKLNSLITSLEYLRFGIFILVIRFLIDNESNFIKDLYFILITIFLILFFYPWILFRENINL